jgi:class 3 adenylate cyclase
MTPWLILPWIVTVNDPAVSPHASCQSGLCFMILTFAAKGSARHVKVGMMLMAFVRATGATALWSDLGTLDQFSGDGIMVFFNDPVSCPDPAERAVKMAVAMREAAGKLIAAWRRHGSELGFGAGIAQGYATLGQIGFSDRSGYTAIGTVCNLAARLCAEAKDGQILVSSRIAEAVGAIARLEDLGNLELRGLRRPVAAFNVVQRNGSPDARPNLTVVANGPGA